MRTVSTLIFALLVTAACGAEHDRSVIKQHKGRVGWKGKAVEWYWLFGNPRKIAPDYWYGDDPFMEDAVRVNDVTREFLYDGPFSPTRIRYVKGSRPMLEEVVAAVTKDAKTEREKCEALLRWCGSFWKQSHCYDPDRFMPSYRGPLPDDPNAVERVIRRGGSSCEWMSRLFCSLTQVCDIPSRLVIRMVHTQSEAYVDGKWRWYDGLRGDHGESSAKRYKELAKDAPDNALRGKSAADVPFLEDRREFAVANFFLGEKTGRIDFPFARKTVSGHARAKRSKVVVETQDALDERFSAKVEEGKLPNGWEAEEGAWSVEDKRLRVRFKPKKPFLDLVRCVTGSDEWSDCCVEADVQREHWGQPDRGIAGLCLRSSAESYIGVLLYDERSVRVFTVAKKVYNALATIPFASEARRQYRLRALCAGDSIGVWVDGRCLGTLEGALPAKGKVGALAGTDASFDNLHVWVKGEGGIETEDVAPEKLLRWKRLLVTSDPPARNVRFLWSSDRGETWRPVPPDLDLGLVTPTTAGLRLRAIVSAGPEPDAVTTLRSVAAEYRWSPEVSVVLPE